MKKFLIVVAGVVVGGLLLMGGCMALIGGAASEVSKEIEKGSTNDRVSAGEVQGAEGGDGKNYTWSDLRVRKDRTLDTFAGSLQVTNETGDPAEVFVTVTAYDGEQTLGSLNGSTRIKPGASTKVDLTSLDDFAKASDYEVEISGF